MADGAVCLMGTAALPREGLSCYGGLWPSKGPPAAMVPVLCVVSACGGNSHLRVKSVGSISITEFGLEIKERNLPLHPPIPP